MKLNEVPNIVYVGYDDGYYIKYPGSDNEFPVSRHTLDEYGLSGPTTVDVTITLSTDMAQQVLAAPAWITDTPAAVVFNRVRTKLRED